MNDTAELARAVHRGDLAAAQKVLSEARYVRSPDNSFNLGIRAAERDLRRDAPLPQLDTDPLLEAIPREKAAGAERFRRRRTRRAA